MIRKAKMMYVKLKDDILKKIEIHFDKFSFDVIKRGKGKLIKRKDGSPRLNRNGEPMREAEEEILGHFSWLEGALTKAYRAVRSEEEKLYLKDYLDKYFELLNKFKNLSYKNLNDLFDLSPIVQENKELKEENNKLKDILKKNKIKIK